MKTDNLWLKYTEEDMTKVKEVCDRYKQCLDNGKTERECVSQVVKMAQQQGYRELHSVIEQGGRPVAGDKLYAVQMDKSVVLFQMGKKPVIDSCNPA